MKRPCNARMSINVRLEGGIGDHILGMRLLRFIREKYPEGRIEVFSDAGGAPAQMELARMSPHVDCVRPIYQDGSRVTLPTLGLLNNIRMRDLRRIRRGDFFDGFTESLYIRESQRLNVSSLDVMSCRPELEPRLRAHKRADQLLSSLTPCTLVGLNMAKYGPDLLRACLPVLSSLINAALAVKNVQIVNFVASSPRFEHWPEPERTRREQHAGAEASIIGAFAQEHHGRMTTVVNESISVVAALLQRCRYFIGVDNGIKHVAWALGVPHSFVVPHRMLSTQWILRYAPDFHRMLQVGCSDGEIRTHVDDLANAVA